MKIGDVKIPRVLVCGGRDYADWLALSRTLDRICSERGWYYDDEDYPMPRVHIISGCAKGADTMAIDWAIMNFLDWSEYPAQWDVYGRRAGPIRNQQMLDEGKPDLVVAFPGGNGTKDMIKRAKKVGVEVIEL